jgi:hypothetical protein
LHVEKCSEFHSPKVLGEKGCCTCFARHCPALAQQLRNCVCEVNLNVMTSEVLGGGPLAVHGWRQDPSQLSTVIQFSSSSFDNLTIVAPRHRLVIKGVCAERDHTLLIPQSKRLSC